MRLHQIEVVSEGVGFDFAVNFLLNYLLKAKTVHKSYTELQTKKQCTKNNQNYLKKAIKFRVIISVDKKFIIPLFFLPSSVAGTVLLLYISTVGHSSSSLSSLPS